MYNRREFLRNSLLAGAGTLALSSLANAARAVVASDSVHLTILHTNDMHSHIDPFPANDPKYPGLGGMGKRATLIRKIREQEANVLLLDAGDIFQGTPYFNFYGGELEFKLMSQMGYDVATIGNHDFDNGIDGLAKMMQHAKFPFVSANYNFNNTVLEGQTNPNHIIERGGIRIGVFGIGVELEGLVNPTLYKETTWTHPLEIANEQARKLRIEQACDFVICLSHIGYQYESEKISDRKLAAQSTNIDLIIGGHTHTFLDEPATVINKDGLPVTIAQVGWAGTKLGRIDVEFQRVAGPYSPKTVTGKAYKLCNYGASG